MKFSFSTPVTLLVVVLALFAIALASSCNKDTATCAPDIKFGQITGTVIHSQTDSKYEISINTIQSETGQSGSYKLPLTAFDTFDLTLPVGKYSLYLEITNFEYHFMARYYYSKEAGCTHRFNADTLEVTSGNSVHIEMILGSMQLRVNLPQTSSITRGKVVPFIPSLPYVLDVDSYVDMENNALRFVLPDLPACSLCFQFYGTHENYERGYYLPQTVDPDSATIFEVYPGLENNQEVTLNEPATISGRIDGSWLAMGCANPRVHLISAASGDIITDVETDETGAFVLSLYAPEPFIARTRSYYNYNWIGGHTEYDCQIFSPTLGGHLSGVNLTESGFQIEVTNPTNEGPYGIGFIVFPSDDPSEAIASRLGEVMRDTTLAIPNLDPGDYYLKLYHTSSRLSAPWIPQWYPGCDRFEDASVITIDHAGTVTNLAIELVTGGTFEIHGEHEPSADEFVVSALVYSVQDSSLVGTCVSEKSPDSNEFVVRALGLADGEYKVTVRTRSPYYIRSGSSPNFWYPGTLDWDDAEIITIQNHNNFSELTYNAPVLLPPTD